MLPEISNGKEVKSGSLNRTDNIVLVTSVGIWKR